MSPTPPAWLSDVALKIAEARLHKEYRPVVVAIIWSSHGQILLVQSAKEPNEWMFPQGGISPEEDVRHALFREIHEEVGIKDQLLLITYKGSFDLGAEATRANKRGFSQGKRYFFFELLYTGPETLTIDRMELADYVWIVPKNLPSQLTTTRDEKRSMMMRFLKS